MPDKLSLAVIDPGLAEADGHHAGFASYIADTYHSAQDQVEVRFFAHRQIDAMIGKRLETANCRLDRHFSTRFYDHIEQTDAFVSLHSYIFFLAQEYLAAFRALNAAGGQKQLLLYHTMSWPHLNALSLAIARHGEANQKLSHLIFLMFNPGVDHEGNTQDSALRLNYRIVLHGLQETPNVRLFAACDEYAREYTQVIRRSSELRLHPCFLADWKSSTQAPKYNKAAQDPQRIILYLGEAKPDKGFNLLPDLIRHWLPALDSDSRLLIQYTSAWNNPAVAETREAIRELAEHEARIELHAGFWSDEALQRCLAQAKLMVFLYQSDAYRDKSSGLLWLSAWHRLPLLVLGESWLTREAKRLGQPVRIIKEWRNFLLPETIRADSPLHDLHQGTTNGNGRKRQQTDTETYRRTIYRSFWDWLQNDLTHNERNNGIF